MDTFLFDDVSCSPWLVLLVKDLLDEVPLLVQEEHARLGCVLLDFLVHPQVGVQAQIEPAFELLLVGVFFVKAGSFIVNICHLGKSAEMLVFRKVLNDFGLYFFKVFLSIRFLFDRLTSLDLFLDHLELVICYFILLSVDSIHDLQVAFIFSLLVLPEILHLLEEHHAHFGIHFLLGVSYYYVGVFHLISSQIKNYFKLFAHF